MAVPESQWPVYVVASKEKPHNNLWNIAEHYYGDGTKYTVLAAINNIPNPNYIVLGQKIYLKDHSDADKSPTTETQVPIVTRLGFQADSDRTILVTWDWNRENTDYYWVRWWYGTDDGIAYSGDTSGEIVYTKYFLFTPPDNAKRVIVDITAHSKSYRITGTTRYAYYWGDDKGNVLSIQKKFELSDREPNTPGVPSITIKGSTLTATSTFEYGYTIPETEQVEFEIIQNDTTRYKAAKVSADLGVASWSVDLALGHKYKVRCRARNEFGVSDWTDFTANYGTQPAAPADITVCKAMSETSVYLEWSASNTAESYEIRYAIAEDLLENSNMSSSISTENSSTQFTIGNLSTGVRWYFRVRAKNGHGESDWSPIKSITIGTTPSSPTTWSSTNIAVVGEDVTLYWTHNSMDNSDQTRAVVTADVYINDSLTRSVNYEIDGSTMFLNVDTTEFPEGAEVWWNVSTAGITGTLSYHSVSRLFKVFAEPSIDIELRDDLGDWISGTIYRYPFRILATTYPSNQRPIGYSVIITSVSDYETTDNVGNKIAVHYGDTVYSKYIPGPGKLDLELSAGDIDLRSGEFYTLSVIAAMDSGLSAKAEYGDWLFPQFDTSTLPNPKAEIVFDYDAFVAHIRPYCEDVNYQIREVTQESDSYVTTSAILFSVYGEPVSGAKTTTGEQVCYGVTGNGRQVYYCTVRTSFPVYEVSLSVYRREFDGSFTEIAKDIENGIENHTFVTDPHPPLDYARYRIVARNKSTSAVTFYDCPPYHVGGDSLIIQWDEAWSNFAIDNGNPSAEPAWTGSMLKLKANVDVSDQYSPDTSFINYIGRKHPVSYYGTQVGETSSWSTVIPKDDKETLYALRRLAVWMGNCYVREPSGSGYWANVKVSFSQKHRDVTIPVSFDITRVEGGM